MDYIKNQKFYVKIEIDLQRGNFKNLARGGFITREVSQFKMVHEIKTASKLHFVPSKGNHLADL